MNYKPRSSKQKLPLILASSSPRRKEILEMVGIECEVIPSLYVEPNHSEHLSDPEMFVEEVASGKGEEVFHRFQKERLVLSADTLGVIEDTVLEKPRDREDAKRMLQLMSGKTHTVMTAIALFSPDKDKPFVRTIKTLVSFRHLEEREIDEYLEEEEYLDKAAAYAIQGRAALFIEKIDGDYYNVMGLPVSTLWEMLKQLPENLVLDER